jgi:hypothetical protein
MCKNNAIKKKRGIHVRKGTMNHQKTEKKTTCTNTDYIWRFRVDDTSDEKSHEDVTVKYIRRQLEELLNFVVLTYNEKKVHINGFKLTKDLEMNYDIFVKSDTAVLSKDSKNANKKEEH